MEKDKKTKAHGLILFLASFLLLCSTKPLKDKFVKIYLPQGNAVTAELAVSEEERQRGLMFREKILPDQGMLFVFEEEGFYSFWMKNTLVSLDILWLDKERRIVHIERDVPPCQDEPCPSYAPGLPALFVLELKSGAALQSQLKLYDRLDFVLPEIKNN